MENNDIKISIKEYLGEDRYTDYPLILKCKTPITIETSEPFIWEGKYKERNILVKIEKRDMPEFAIIEGIDGLNIEEKIRDEINRIIRKLN